MSTTSSPNNNINNCTIPLYNMFVNQVHVCRSKGSDSIHAVVLVEIEHLILNYLLLTRLLAKFWHLVIRKYVYGKNHLHFLSSSCIHFVYTLILRHTPLLLRFFYKIFYRSIIHCYSYTAFSFPEFSTRIPSWRRRRINNTPI